MSMSTTESLGLLRNKLNILENNLFEAKGHLDHPEDLVFLQGSVGANQAITSILNTVKNPKQITIKWDGYPALIFGRSTNKKFSIMDKHMFNKRDGTGRQIFSSREFREYDVNRGVDRSQLHNLIDRIWAGLEKSDNSIGYYWGDLLFSEPLQLSRDGLYHFRPNPNGIEYTVEPNSDLGKQLTNKQAAIAVHQFIPSDALSTDDSIPLNGTIGNLKNVSNVAIVPAKMPITPELKIDSSILQSAKASVAKYGKDLDALLNTAPQAESAFKSLFTTYINKKIVSQNLNNLLSDFMKYFESRPMTEKMRSKLEQHFANNKEGLIAAFTIWTEIYKLKMAMVNQLNKAAETAPVQGYLQNGTRTQEGFVSQGLKFVDRMGFSAQNLAGR